MRPIGKKYHASLRFVCAQDSGLGYEKCITGRTSCSEDEPDLSQSSRTLPTGSNKKRTRGSLVTSSKVQKRFKSFKTSSVQDTSPERRPTAMSRYPCRGRLAISFLFQDKGKTDQPARAMVKIAHRCSHDRYNHSSTTNSANQNHIHPYLLTHLNFFNQLPPTVDQKGSPSHSQPHNLSSNSQQGQSSQIDYQGGPLTLVSSLGEAFRFKYMLNIDLECLHIFCPLDRYDALSRRGADLLVPLHTIPPESSSPPLFPDSSRPLIPLSHSLLTTSLPSMNVSSTPGISHLCINPHKQHIPSSTSPQSATNSCSLPPPLLSPRPLFPNLPSPSSQSSSHQLHPTITSVATGSQASHMSMFHHKTHMFNPLSLVSRKVELPTLPSHPVLVDPQPKVDGLLHPFTHRPRSTLTSKLSSDPLTAASPALTSPDSQPQLWDEVLAVAQATVEAAARCRQRAQESSGELAGEVLGELKHVLQLLTSLTPPQSLPELRLDVGGDSVGGPKAVSHESDASIKRRQSQGPQFDNDARVPSMVIDRPPPLIQHKLIPPPPSDCFFFHPSTSPRPLNQREGHGRIEYLTSLPPPTPLSPTITASSFQALSSASTNNESRFVFGSSNGQGLWS